MGRVGSPVADCGRWATGFGPAPGFAPWHDGPSPRPPLIVLPGSEMRVMGNFAFYPLRLSPFDLQLGPFSVFSTFAIVRGGAFALACPHGGSERTPMPPQLGVFVVRLLFISKPVIGLNGCGRLVSVHSVGPVCGLSSQGALQRLISPSMGLFGVRKIKRMCDGRAGWAQVARCRLAGWSPVVHLHCISCRWVGVKLGGWLSGRRQQAVNLPVCPAVVRIHLRPVCKTPVA